MGWDGLIPQGIPFTDINLQRTLITVGLPLDWSDPTVRPVGLCRTGYSAPTGQTARSDWSDRLMPILAVNICPPIFLVKFICQKTFF